MLLPLPMGSTARTSELSSATSASDCPGLSPGYPNFSESKAVYVVRSVGVSAPWFVTVSEIRVQPSEYVLVFEDQ